MSKLSKVQKIYGRDYGVKDTGELVKWLKEHSWSSLADLLELRGKDE